MTFTLAMAGGGALPIDPAAVGPTGHIVEEEGGDVTVAQLYKAIGGCCGTTPEHIAAMAKAVQS